MTEHPCAGRELLLALKNTAGAPGPQLTLVVGRPPVALLRPVATRRQYLNPDDVKVLTSWRNKFVRSFLTEFEATEARTAQWLTQVVGPNSGKLLFMVDESAGQTFAYMGLDFIDWQRRTGEADAIVRGGEAPPGTMTQALKTLMTWARTALGLEQLGVRVRSDNPALGFYRKMGFIDERRVPLRRTEEPGLVRWVPDSAVRSPEVELVHMVWQPASS
jgi:RimJ/RimL family protein N-acetyltransferase